MRGLGWPRSWETEIEVQRSHQALDLGHCMQTWVRVPACVLVCVREGGRERERGRKGEKERKDLMDSGMR